MRILTFLFVAVLPVAAGAGEINFSATKDRPMVMAAVPLTLRAEPSLDAAAVVEVSLMEHVRVLDETGPAAAAEGQADRWTLVAAMYPHCVDGDCMRRYTGWVLDSDLGYDDRFEPLALGRAATVAGYAGTAVFSYAIEADGGLTLWYAHCSARDCDIVSGVTPNCGKSRERDGFCVASGRLYRYHDAVRVKSADGTWLGPVNFRFDDSGELCAYQPERHGAARMCERSGPYAAFGPGPKVAVAAVMAARRKMLALTAADMLNLRAEPSTGVEIVTRVPRGSSVTVLEPVGPAITIGGQADRWVKLRVDTCYSFTESGLCDPGATGWAVDGYLAYADRLKPVTEWRPGMIGGYGGDYGFSYLFLEDGTFEYTVSCGDYIKGESCTSDGRLYRYRDLVLARSLSTGRHEVLSIDAQGRLCFPPAEEKGDILYETGEGRPTRCDR